MPQLSLYIDEPTLKKVRSAARRNGTSVSRWIRGRLAVDADQSWPESFLRLYGSITDDTFRRPSELLSKNDVPREAL